MCEKTLFPNETQVYLWKYSCASSFGDLTGFVIAWLYSYIQIWVPEKKQGERVTYMEYNWMNEEEEKVWKK